VLERVFRLSSNGTSPRAEALAGLATFWSMAYIIFANPAILAAAGVPFEGAVVGTCLASALATAGMGLWTNRPLALAPAMGLNAFVAFGVIGALGLPWQAGMGLVVVHGLVLALLGWRGWAGRLAGAVPPALRRGVGAGVGLLVALVGLQQAGLVVPSAATLLTAGSLWEPRVFAAGFGILLTAVLLARRFPGAIFAGVVGTAVFSVLVGAQDLPPAVFRLPAVSGLLSSGRLDFRAVPTLGGLAVVLTLLMADLFDTAGTLDALERQGGFQTRRERVLVADGLATAGGGLLGVSALTTYAESAAGIAAGGRTGLTSVVVAVLFGLSVFFAPLVGLVPGVAVAPALVAVGYLMAAGLRDVPLDRFDEAFATFVTVLTIPLTFSVVRGLGYGFLVYLVIRLSTGRAAQIDPLLYALAAMLLVSFLIG